MVVVDVQGDVGDLRAAQSQVSESRPGARRICREKFLLLSVEVYDSGTAADLFDPDVLHAGSFGVEVVSGYDHLPSERLIISIAGAIEVGQEHYRIRSCVSGRSVRGLDWLACCSCALECSGREQSCCIPPDALAGLAACEWTLIHVFKALEAARRLDESCGKVEGAAAGQPRSSRGKARDVSAVEAKCVVAAGALCRCRVTKQKRSGKKTGNGQGGCRQASGLFARILQLGEVTIHRSRFSSFLVSCGR